MREVEEDLDKEVARRHVIISVNDETGELELDHSSIATWELAGVGAWLCAEADRMLAEED